MMRSHGVPSLSQASIDARVYSTPVISAAG